MSASIISSPGRRSDPAGPTTMTGTCADARTDEGGPSGSEVSHMSQGSPSLATVPPASSMISHALRLAPSSSRSSPTRTFHCVLMPSLHLTWLPSSTSLSQPVEDWRETPPCG